MQIIPKKSRNEWKKLLLGEINISLKNFFFQMKVTQTKNLLKSGKIDLESAIEDIYTLCVKFSKAKNMSEDLETIFGKNLVSEVSLNNNKTDDFTKVETNNKVKTKIESDNNDKIDSKPVIKLSDKPKITTTFKGEKKENVTVSNDIIKEIERIKKEAAERELFFERKRIEMQKRISEEQNARKEAEKRVLQEKRKRILEAENRAKNNQNNEKSTRTKDLLAQKEIDALYVAKKAKFSSTASKPKEKVKKTFLQRLFNY